VHPLFGARLGAVLNTDEITPKSLYRAAQPAILWQSGELSVGQGANLALNVEAFRSKDDTWQSNVLDIQTTKRHRDKKTG
jgi:hypothetical protein